MDKKSKTTTTTIDFVNEFEIDEKVKTEIKNLLAICFPDTDYNNRTYFKQLPHYRLIMKVDNTVIGQVALDYRAMNLNNSLVTVLGVIDLAIHPTFQNIGLGSKLITEIERIALINKNNIDFLFLVTDKSTFYERLGYTQTTQNISWLKIDQGKNYGLGNEQVTDCFLMFKSIGNKKWTDGKLDMLGYWY